MKKHYFMWALCALSLTAYAEEEPTSPMVSTTETITVPLGTSATIEAIFMDGTAPYTVQWLSPKRAVLNEQVFATQPEDIISYSVTPEECGDYVVRVIDANKKEGTDTVRIITTGKTVTATFEGLYLDEEGFNIGASADGSNRYASFTSGSFAFNTNCEYSGAYWYGCAYTNSKSNSYNSLSDQNHSVTGGGYQGSDNFAVCYYTGAWGTPPIITALNSELGTALTGCYITNSAYAYNAMSVGDGFARAFAQGDWLKVTFTADNGKTVDYYLGDYRSEDVTKNYILNQWDWVDLSPLGQVKTVTLSMSGSDMGAYGLNTPAYVCLDDFNGTAPATSVNPTYINKVGTTSSPQYYNINGMRSNTIQPGINIIRLNDGTIRKVAK